MHKEIEKFYNKEIKTYLEQVGKIQLPCFINVGAYTSHRELRKILGKYVMEQTGLIGGDYYIGNSLWKCILENNHRISTYKICTEEVELKDIDGKYYRGIDDDIISSNKIERQKSVQIYNVVIEQ